MKNEERGVRGTLKFCPKAFVARSTGVIVSVVYRRLAVDASAGRSIPVYSPNPKIC